jgi:hypothetical protein
MMSMGAQLEELVFTREIGLGPLREEAARGEPGRGLEQRAEGESGEVGADQLALPERRPVEQAKSHGAGPCEVARGSAWLESEGRGATRRWSWLL